MLDKRQNRENNSNNSFFNSQQKKTEEQLFNAISDPILIIDEGCIIKKANSSAQNILKLNSNNSNTNKNFLNFVNSKQQKEEILKNIKTSDSKIEVVEHVNFASNENSKFYAHVHIAKNEKELNNNNFTLLLKQDEKQKELEKTNQLKSEFLTQMSHEIRTPLNTMLSFTNLIQEEVKDKVSEDLNNSFNHINSAGKRIIRTIDLLLNLSEIHSGTYEFLPSKFNLVDDILKKLCSDLSKSINNANLIFNYEFREGNYEIIADRFKVEDIFKHLIENAIKFTKEGHISLIGEQTDDKKLIIKIIDTGIGISEKYLPIMFDPFTQEEQGYSRAFDGNGVGLALVKRYCELNNIDLDVTSKKAEGTIFTLIFNQPTS